MSFYNLYVRARASSVFTTVPVLIPDAQHLYIYSRPSERFLNIECLPERIQAGDKKCHVFTSY